MRIQAGNAGSELLYLCWGQLSSISVAHPHRWMKSDKMSNRQAIWAMQVLEMLIERKDLTEEQAASSLSVSRLNSLDIKPLGVFL